MGLRISCHVRNGRQDHGGAAHQSVDRTLLSELVAHAPGGIDLRSS
jgi:hypothetical protein